MAGRKPKPTALKKLEGNPGKRKLNTKEPVPAKGMRKNLNTIYPKIFGTVLSPKAEELIATPYRFEGDADKAKDYFEEGMSKALL